MMYAKYYLGVFDVFDVLGVFDVFDVLGVFDFLGDGLGCDIDASILLFCLKANLALANNIAEIRGAILKPPVDLTGFFFAAFAIGIFYYNYNKLIFIYNKYLNTIYTAIIVVIKFKNINNIMKGIK